MRSIPYVLLGLALLAGAKDARAQDEAPVTELTEKGLTFEFYGYAMTDTGYNFGTNNPDWFDVLRPTKLPSFRGEFGEGGRTFMGVRQSRFGVKADMPTSLGRLNTIFEFEMFGVGVDAGQTTFRLRHFFGELGEFGAGQTWSAFMDIDVFPNSIEYWGPNAMPFFRNVQVRWLKTNGKSHFNVALERPGGSADLVGYDTRIELEDVVSRFPLPDLTANARLGGDWGYVQLGGIARYISWDDVGTDEFDLAGDAVGWGFVLSSNVMLGEKNVLKLLGVYGEAIENYINDAGDDIGLVTSGAARRPLEGVALPVWGALAFVDIYWNDLLSSTAGYSIVEVDNSAGQVPEAFHRGQYALANLLFHPTEHFMLGPELQWANRANHSNDYTYDDYRVQFSLKYDFSITISEIGEK